MKLEIINFIINQNPKIFLSTLSFQYQVIHYHSLPLNGLRDHVF